MEQKMEFTAARDMLLSLVEPVARTERVPLTESWGRVLAEDVFAKGDVPPFDRSPFDGYAFQAADTFQASEETPVTLRILEEVPAGSMWTQAVTPGTATKILTGAPVPPGANAITKYEETEFTAEAVKLFHPYKEGENVIPQGEDVRAGALLAHKGEVIDPAMAGTIAAQGVVQPLVYARPVVGLITTGSELSDAGSELSGGKIINTNRYTFQAALERAGCEVKFLGAPVDTTEGIAALMEKAFDECDLLVTTGGVSVGDYDLTPAALQKAGAELLIRKLAIKPGGASAYGRKNGKLACCLSGNPAASMTNLYAVVLPVLRKLRGLARPQLTAVKVALREPFGKKSPQTRLLRGILVLEDGTAKMAITGEQGNGVLHTMIGCNLLAVVPKGTGKLPEGTVLDAYLID